MINTVLIQQKFEQSSFSYNKNAIAQKEIANYLYQKIDHYTKNKPLNRVLEIGCGTGLLTQSIANLNPDIYYLNDINQYVKNLIQPILKNTLHEILLGDAESQQFPYHLDMVVSSSCFQWLHNLPLFLNRISKHIKTDGFLFFSSFGQSNLKEVKSISGKGLIYPSLDDVIKISTPRYQLIFAEEKHIKLYFNTPYEVLKHLKNTGVNGGFNTVWTKSKLNDFCKSYQTRFSEHNQVTLTYHPLYIGLKKL